MSVSELIMTQKTQHHDYTYEDDPRSGLKQMSDMLPVLDRDASARIKIDVVYGYPRDEWVEKLDGYDADSEYLTLDGDILGPEDLEGVDPDYIEEVQVDVLEQFVEDFNDEIDWSVDDGELKKVGETVLRFHRCGREWPGREWNLTQYTHRMVEPETESEDAEKVEA